MAQLVVGVALMACASGPAQGAPDSPEALRAVPLEVTTDGNAPLRLEVDAWRSWQPIRPTPAGDGDPLIAVVRLVSTAPIPPTLAIEAVHLLRGADRWSPPPVEESPREAGARTVEVTVRKGPDWAAGDSIDVVAVVRTAGGSGVRVRAPRVAIARVD